MNDPTRFRDGSADAPAELRRLFQAGTDDLPAEAELAGLAARLGPLFVPPPVERPITLSTASKVAVVSAVVVLFALNFGPHTPRPPDAPESSSPSETPPAPRSALPSAASGDAAANSAAPASAKDAAPIPPGAATAPSSSPSAEASARSSGASLRPAESEAELLERARGSLASNPSRALALTEQHRARFPGGVLTQEREVIAIEALKRLGRTDEAARRAADFARRYPGSAYKKKLDTGRP